MKLNTLTRKYVTAEINEWTGPTDNRVYGTSRDIACALIPDSGAYALITDEPLLRFTRVQNLRDRNGSAILPELAGNEAVFEVLNSQAVIDAYGYLSGYRVSIRRIS